MGEGGFPFLSGSQQRDRLAQTISVKAHGCSKSDSKGNGPEHCDLCELEGEELGPLGGFG